MNRPRSLHFVWAILFAFTLVQTSTSCWGPMSNGYGETTPDYDLHVGSELVIDCNLKSNVLPKISVPINSSFLIFKRDSDHKIFSSYTHQVDELTLQLRIPNANVNDSGLYHCQIALPDSSKHLVCSTNVYVGYPPKNVSNFKCISRNFDNLTCTWNVEPNNVRTNYTLQKIFFQNGLHNCPKPNNNTFCMWSDDTEPPYLTMTKNLTFVIKGNNSLGTVENEFKFEHFAIVIPNSPEKLTTTDVAQQSFTVEWLPPNMPRKVFEKPAIFYQVWLEELEPNPADKIVVDVGVEKFNFTFENLLPHFKYKVSVRCRSNYTSDENMWSSFISTVIKTYPDVPYVVPEVNPEAFLIQNFGNYRNVTLYWKPVSKRFYNGDGFYYYIEYNQNDHSGKTYTEYVTSNTTFVRIGHLHNDSSYSFHIHSANKEGVSDGYQTIFIDKRSHVPPAVRDIRAISHELEFYNLTWSNGDSSDVNYTVFWCAGRKPSYCDGPIQWSKDVLKEPTFALEVADVMSNFQFAVAASYKHRSSGMQWASCIVPSKAPLGQIPITHIEPTSTTLRVIWKLDCDAQKSVIDRYVITYCRENKGCEDAVAEPDVQSYTLKNLHPFSNYSVKLRAFNKENKPSEDIDGMYQTTLSGGPSDSPQNVSILSKTNSTLLVKWMPPLEPNGIITHYFIYHNEFKQIMRNGSSCKSCEFLIEDLKPYTYYDISIEACVDVYYCSNKSETVTGLTDVGVPGKMDPPRIEPVNETHLKVLWTAPGSPNGPVNYYDIQWQQEMGNETINQTISWNESLSAFIEFKCSNLLDGGIPYLFSIRAVNEKNGTFFYGPFSNLSKGTACVMSQGLAMIIGVAIGGTLALAIFLLVVYKLIKWMSEKIHQVKNIAVRLPKELEGPETNPLNNYESFKKGLVQSIHNGKIDQKSYVINETDNKNRHGSGSSQFSNASTDELIFKNGKCTKFGRKPSGDSSGCSSMSSNTTTRMHLSSDSGTESDFMVPASPDPLTADQTILNNQKPHMPILMEIHDPPETPNEALAKSLPSKPETYNSFANGMVLKVDHAYSKFGISGNMASNAPCQINPLAFYSCNLANSEPSVFEAPSSGSQKLSVLPPYSKLGLAKSSVDIPGICSRNKELGYSKFGFGSPQNCFSIDTDKLNPIIGLALIENSVPNNLVKAQAGLYLRNGRFGRPCETDILPSYAMNYQIPKSVANKENSSFKNPTPGYVTVGDMRSCKRPNSLSLSESSIEAGDSSLPSPEDLSVDLPFVNPDWVNDILCASQRKLDDPSFLGQDSADKPLINSQRDDSLDMKLVSSPSSGCVQIKPPREPVLNEEELSNKLDSLSNFQENQLTVPSSPDGDSASTLHSIHSNKQVSSGGEQNSEKPPEVVLNPVAGRNGYVPFSTLSSVCDPLVSTVPNAIESNISPSVFPDDACTNIDQNYITPSNKSDLKLLQEGLISKNRNFSPLLHCNGKKMHKISKPLKYILKPLPKMESEICEV